MHWIQEPARQIPVCCEADVCVVGGSCTGVFAAVRAARLGARVVLIERQNRFGGVAANGLVNIWHSLMDTGNTEQIIAGLTDEVLGRLRANDAVMAGRDAWSAHIFNPNELAIILDDLVREHRIKPYLHTQYAALVCDGDTITHVLVENKDGRSAIAARFFIDATGDGDLARDLHLHEIKPLRLTTLLRQVSDTFLPNRTDASRRIRLSVHLLLALFCNFRIAALAYCQRFPAFFYHKLFPFAFAA